MKKRKQGGDIKRKQGRKKLCETNDENKKAGGKKAEEKKKQNISQEKGKKEKKRKDLKERGEWVSGEREKMRGLYGKGWVSRMAWG
jgi:hypothetical protein